MFSADNSSFTKPKARNFKEIFNIYDEQQHDNEFTVNHYDGGEECVIPSITQLCSKTQDATVHQRSFHS